MYILFTFYNMFLQILFISVVVVFYLLAFLGSCYICWNILTLRARKWYTHKFFCVAKNFRLCLRCHIFVKNLTLDGIFFAIYLWHWDSSFMKDFIHILPLQILGHLEFWVKSKLVTNKRKIIDVSRTWSHIPMEKIFHFFTAGSSFTERVDNEKDKKKI